MQWTLDAACAAFSIRVRAHPANEDDVRELSPFDGLPLAIELAAARFALSTLAGAP